MSAKIIIYSSAHCPFCVRAKQLLRNKGVQQFEEIAIDRDLQERERMIERTGRRTVPQIYVGDRHVGGYDDLAALERRGELDALLA